MLDWSLFSQDVNHFATLRTAISCPFSCAFCGFPEHAGKYQTIDVELVEKELDAIAAIGTVKSISFVDDTFNISTEAQVFVYFKSPLRHSSTSSPTKLRDRLTPLCKRGGLNENTCLFMLQYLPPRRFKKFLKMMIKNNYEFTWNAYYRCQFADDETVAMMKESGCEGVFLGIESASQTIIDNMNKAVKVDKYKNGLSLLNQYGITSHANFIIGFPGETDKTIQESVNFIEEYQPTFFRTQMWYCEPITPIWRQKDKYGIKGSHFEWEHNTMNAITSADIVDELFLSIKNATWLPQYDLDFFGLFRILPRGMTIEQLTRMIQAFNVAVQKKLVGKEGQDVSSEGLKKLETAYYSESGEDKEKIPFTATIEKNQMLEAEFDF